MLSTDILQCSQNVEAFLKELQSQQCQKIKEVHKFWNFSKESLRLADIIKCFKNLFEQLCTVQINYISLIKLHSKMTQNSQINVTDCSSLKPVCLRKKYPKWTFVCHFVYNILVAHVFTDTPPFAIYWHHTFYNFLRTPFKYECDKSSRHSSLKHEAWKWQCHIKMARLNCKWCTSH